jgi:hypothetical protein
MPLSIINGPFIRAGESLSEALDCSGGDLVRITMPGGWSNAALSFMVSTDNIYFNDLYFADGREVVVMVTPGCGVIVPPAASASIAWIKFRSGTTDHPVVQPVEREFAVAVRT